MLRRVSFAIVTAAFLIQPANLAAKPLAPTAKWVVDYRTDQCLASREYGTAKYPVTFGIRPSPNGKSYLLLFAGKGSGPQLAREEPTTVDFGNGPIKTWLLEYGSKPSGSDTYQLRIAAAEMDQAKTAATIKISRKGAEDIELQLQSIPALMKTLEDCTANLQRYWNMGGEKDGRITTPSKGDVRSAFSDEDYPEEALLRSQEGQAQFLLLIDETGKVAGCDVIVASGIPALDAMGCQAIRNRAKFSPARDANGKAARSAVVTPPVKWSE